jgi:hypothetical protein
MLYDSDMTIRTSVETVCFGDLIEVEGVWEKIIDIAQGKLDVATEKTSLIYTDKNHILAVAPGTLVEVR